MKAYYPPELQETSARYAELPMEPLLVTAHVNNAVYIPDPLFLDGILGAAVVRERCGSSLINMDGLIDCSPVVPVPIKALWHNKDGFPLMASTAFKAEGYVESDVYYHHKRHQPGTFTKRTRSGQPFSVKASDGRWMDRQRPLTVQVVERLTCRVIGNPDEIQRLLLAVDHIGKERSRGLGRVSSWSIEEVDEFRLVEDGRLQANVPYEAATELALNLEDNLTLGAWTTPRWQRGLHTLMYPIGTRLKAS